jgi:anthranilate synthase component 1
VLQQDKIHLQVGGAIVSDSDPEAEYEETLAKSRAALRALGTELEKW